MRRDEITAATERHYQRASNHNISAALRPSHKLKDIIKEHQITTGLAKDEWLAN